MNVLVTRTPKRLFAFGCSFTKYSWGCTWPEIIAKDLIIPYYNFGQSGAGNQYIANMISQADLMYNFNEDDLVIVQWTNICREDRWVNGQWSTPGNIFTQNDYDKNFVAKWADPIGYMIRDFSTINFTLSLLENKGCQYHMLSMVNIAEKIDQSSNLRINNDLAVYHNRVKTLYKEVLEKIKPSFFDVLWNNDIWTYKLRPEQKILGEYYSDGHPTPLEHLVYLKKVFNDHIFESHTYDSVRSSQENYIRYINQLNEKYKKEYAVYQLTNEEKSELKRLTTIRPSESFRII